jgi:hypothetical protein
VRLGILVTTDRNRGLVRGIAQAALAQGHTVAVFAMDEGARLLADPLFTGLALLPGLTMSFCDLSFRRLFDAPPEMPPAIVEGSQYDNALMNHDADKVIVL